MSQEAFNQGTIEGAPVIDCMTAFTVVVARDGRAFAVAQVPEYIHTEYTATARSIKAACIEISDDIRAGDAAQYVLDSFPEPKPTIAERLAARMQERSE